MKAIIPVAGSGTRLRPLTHTKPKALLFVGTKPIIIHIVESIVHLGCNSFIFIISPDGEIIPNCVKSWYPELDITSIVQQKPLGLGHAVSLAEQAAGDDDILVFYGDTIIDDDLSRLTTGDADGIVSICEVEDPRKYGILTVDDDVIKGFEEKPSKPQSNLAIVGCNYFRRPKLLFSCLHEIIDNTITMKGEYQLTDAFQRMVKHGCKLAPFYVKKWLDCGTPESLLETNRYILNKENMKITRPDSIIIRPVSIPEGTIVKQSIIGPYVSIGKDACIERSIIADSIIGSGAHIRNTSFSHSLIGDYVEVAERTRRLFLGDNSSFEIDSINPAG